MTPVIQRRVKYAGHGKTVNKSGIKVSGIKFDINALNLMCRYVMSDNKKIRRSQLIKMRNVIEIMDMAEYTNKPQLLERIEFVRKALYGRIEKNLSDPGILLRYVSGGLMEDDIDTDIRPLNNDEIDWMNETISGCLKFAFIHDDIETGLELFTQFKAADYRSREEIVEKIEIFNTKLQNKFRQAKLQSAHEEMFTLKDGEFESVVRDVYDDTTNPSMVLYTGVQGFNEMLGGGFTGGRVYTLLGLPGEGKSMTMLDMAYQIKQHNKGLKPKDPTKIPCVAVLTMENSVRETVQRLFAIVTKGESMANYDIEQVIRMLKEEGELYISDDSPINIIIKYVPAMSVDTSYLYTLTEDLEDEGYEVIFMVQDYLKKIRSTERYDDIRIECGQIVDEMKAFATIKDIPVLTASQLNREAVKSIDENRKKNGADSVRLIGRNNIGESMLILDNSDAVFMIAPEYAQDGKYLGIQRVKNRMYASDRTIIYQPFEPNSPALVQDVGGAPMFKETMNEMVNVPSPKTQHKINNVMNFDDLVVGNNKDDDLFAETMMTPNISRAAMARQDGLIHVVTFRSEASQVEPDGYLKQPRLISPVTFTRPRETRLA